jgi:hypothetical protein
MKPSTRTRSLLSPRRYVGVGAVAVAVLLLSVVLVCNEQHQAEAFSTSSPLLGIRPSTSCKTANSRVGHGRSPWSDDNSDNDNNSPRRSRTLLSVSSTKAGEQLKTTRSSGTGTDTEAPITFEGDEHENDRIAKEEFQKGFRIIGFITLLNASLAPVWCVLRILGGICIRICSRTWTWTWI